jgi:hypothetical protein
MLAVQVILTQLLYAREKDDDELEVTATASGGGATGWLRMVMVGADALLDWTGLLLSETVEETAAVTELFVPALQYCFEYVVRVPWDALFRYIVEL